MNVSDMRIFLTVAEELNVSHAADRLFLSQSAVTRAVQRFEQSVGTPLFDRRGHRFRLTTAGESLVSRIDALLRELDLVIAETRTIAEDEAKIHSAVAPLRVGILVPGAAELTRPILLTYATVWPGAPVHLVDVSRIGGERALLDGTVDAAILWTPVNEDGISVARLFDDPLRVLLPQGHRLAEQERLDADQLAEERYTVTWSMGSRWQDSSQLAPWKRKPHHALRVLTVNDAMDAVAEGNATTIGPSSLERYGSVPGIVYVPFAAPGYPTSVACCRVRDRRPHVRGFLTIARSVAEHHRDVVPGAIRPASW